MPCNLYVFKVFSGGKGLSLALSLCTLWEALRNKNLTIQTRLRGWYQARFFGLIFGHSWGIGQGPGWHLVRCLCETRKALHERHVLKTLKETCQESRLTWPHVAQVNKGHVVASGLSASTSRISSSLRHLFKDQNSGTI